MRIVKHGAGMHGTLIAASVLNTPRALEISLYVVRALVRLRDGAVLAIPELNSVSLDVPANAPPACALSARPEKKVKEADRLAAQRRPSSGPFNSAASRRCCSAADGLVGRLTAMATMRGCVR